VLLQVLLQRQNNPVHAGGIGVGAAVAFADGEAVKVAAGKGVAGSSGEGLGVQAGVGEDGGFLGQRVDCRGS